MSALADAALALLALQAAILSGDADVIAIRGRVLDAIACLCPDVRRIAPVYSVEAALVDGRVPRLAAVEAALFELGVEALTDLSVSAPASRHAIRPPEMTTADEPAGSERETLPAAAGPGSDTGPPSGIHPATERPTEEMGVWPAELTSAPPPSDPVHIGVPIAAAPVPAPESAPFPLVCRRGRPIDVFA